MALTVLVALLLIAAGFWAGRVTLRPAAVTPDLAESEVLVEVTEQTVGRSLNLNVTVSQPERALAVNALSGVVTAVREPGEATVGDVLYRVAGVPVRAVQGTVPFYRPLAAGDRGDDVRQLQDALVALGHLPAADGRFGASTTRAVLAWQRQLGTAETGTVAQGELVAVPSLPSALVLDEELISVGGVLEGGEEIVLGASGDPTFVLRLAQQQAQLVPQSATITLDYDGHTWSAVITGTEQNEQGETILHLAAPDGRPVCGADCATVATGEELHILSRVAVVAPASGPAVPVAALTTQPDGTTTVWVVDAAGVRTARPVTVLGSQDGVAVVQGVEAGEQVQVLAASGVGTAAPLTTPGR